MTTMMMMMITLLHETRSETKNDIEIVKGIETETGIETGAGIETEKGTRTETGTRTEIGTEIDTQVDDHHLHSIHHTLERIHTFHSLLNTLPVTLLHPILPLAQDQILFLFLYQNTLHLHSILTS